ncbi:MAG: DUF5610 domain-containing protein [Gammaproteobacteria bacterium]|nr:DUF5610 domain-containing protein [Gammaproteobacteria bacterium]
MNTVSATHVGYSYDKISVQTPSDTQSSVVDASEGASVGGGEANVISLPTAEDAQKVFNQRILATVSEQLNALNVHLELAGAAPIETLLSEDFTAEKVAERILGFITAGIAGLDADDPDRTRLLAAARSGFEQGYAEAKEILVGLGVFAGGVLETAEKTYELIQQGLDKLEGVADAATVEA